MGNLIKINMYVELTKERFNVRNLKTTEEIILKYKDWLKYTNREDKIENYEEFLQKQYYC